MEFTKYDDGQPCWIDVCAPDPTATAAFYGALLGWTVEPGPPETGGYANGTVGGKNVAGIAPQMQPGPSYWGTYIKVANVGATLARVTDLGGSVLVPEMPVMDLGTMGIFTDPTGATLGLWAPGTHIGAELANENGTWGWSELLTRDVAASKAFYTALFGWTVTEAEGPMQYSEWQLAGRSIGGVMPMPEMVPAEVPPNWGVYFGVADVDASVRKVRELGGAVFMEPTDIEPGRFAVVADPAGATFNLITMKPELTGS